MKKLFALIMLIFSVAPACGQVPAANQNSSDPMAEFKVEQLKKALQAREGKAWYGHHRQYDPHLENGICVENCDGVVEVARSAPVADAVSVPDAASVPDSVPFLPPPRKVYKDAASVPDSVPFLPPPRKVYNVPSSSNGRGFADMLAGARCIIVPPSGCQANWTAKRHAKRVAYHAPVCR
jgi:hypothetical protein